MSVLYCRSRQQTELGKIVNLMSADVNHVMQFFYPFFNQLFSAPALLIASLILLYFQIRYALCCMSLPQMCTAFAPACQQACLSAAKLLMISSMIDLQDTAGDLALV